MFLATTALDEFWDKNQEILFLGFWCLRHDRKAEWEHLKFQVLPCPWNNRARFYEAARELDQCGERMLGHLAEYLNSVHSTEHSTRYWRIIVGPWLIHYLHVFYDRYVLLQEAFGKCRDLQSVVMDGRSFKCPRDMPEFLRGIVDDPYNLQIFSFLLVEMGFNFPSVPLQVEERTTAEQQTRTFGRLGRDAVKWAMFRGAQAVSRINDRQWDVALGDIGCSWGIKWALMWKTGFRALPLETIKEWPFVLPGPDWSEARRGLGNLPFTSEIERLFIRSLSDNFPTLYLEAYPLAKEESRRLTRKAPPELVAAYGWLNDEPFKFAAAEIAERGGRIVPVQHGGGYGVLRASPLEAHESRIGDSFVTWGWAEKRSRIFQNLPSPYVSSLVSNGDFSSRHDASSAILFVAITDPRYLARFYSLPVGSQWEEYFSWQQRFLAALPLSTRSQLLFRPYPNDGFGHAIRERVAAQFDLRWDESGKLHHRLKDVRITVIDNCATSFLEVLAANTPTLLFWDPMRWEVRDVAQPYFDRLRQAGILWDSPESAAVKLAEVYDVSFEWWNSIAVQEARLNFVDRYAMARTNWVDPWVKFLNEEIAVRQGSSSRLVTAVNTLSQKNN